MTDIPEDIMREARELFDGYSMETVMTAARAILAEREVWQDRMQKLHRRVQKFEGAEESFRGSFRMWCDVLFKTRYDKEARLHDYQGWQREIDKAWANGRAAEAEARLSDAVAAERERCASLATTSTEFVPGLPWHHENNLRCAEGMRIARLIRNEPAPQQTLYGSMPAIRSPERAGE